MYKRKKLKDSIISINRSYAGETIEDKIRRITSNKEPIKDGAPLVYTKRSDGVIAGMDIRTDRWEIAVEAMDKIQKVKTAKREEARLIRMKKDVEGEQSTQGNAETN